MQTEPQRVIRFSQRQSAVVTNALAILAGLFLVLVVGAAFWAVARFVSAHSGVLIPPLAAVILAKVVQPLHDALRRGLWGLVPARRRRSRAVRGLVAASAIVALLLVIIVPVAAFFWFFGSLVAEQLAALVRRVPDAVRWLWDRVPDLKVWLHENELEPIVQMLDPQSWFDVPAVAEEVKTRALTVVGGVPALFGAVTNWLMVLVYLVIYLASRPLEGGDFSRVLLGVSDRTRESVRFLLDEFIRIVVAFFRGQVVVAIIEGCLFGLGFQFIAGLPYGLTLGLLVGIVNIIPYMGSFFVMPPVCIFAYFCAGGGWGTLLLVVAVWAAVGLADFYITPAVVGDRTGLSAFAVIFSLLFWGEVIGGFAGIFLAIPISAFLVVAYRFVSREYFSTEKAVPAPPSPEKEKEPADGV